MQVYLGKLSHTLCNRGVSLSKMLFSLFIQIIKKLIQMVAVGHLRAVEKLFQVSLVRAFGSELEVKVQDSTVHCCLEIGLEIYLVGVVLLRRLELCY